MKELMTKCLLMVLFFAGLQALGEASECANLGLISRQFKNMNVSSFEKKLQDRLKAVSEVCALEAKQTLAKRKSLDRVKALAAAVQRNGVDAHIRSFDAELSKMIEQIHDLIERLKDSPKEVSARGNESWREIEKTRQLILANWSQLRSQWVELENLPETSDVAELIQSAAELEVGYPVRRSVEALKRNLPKRLREAKKSRVNKFQKSGRYVLSFEKVYEAYYTIYLSSFIEPIESIRQVYSEVLLELKAIGFWGNLKARLTPQLQKIRFSYALDKVCFLNSERLDDIIQEIQIFYTTAPAVYKNHVSSDYKELLKYALSIKGELEGCEADVDTERLTLGKQRHFENLKNIFPRCGEIAEDRGERWELLKEQVAAFEANSIKYKGDDQLLGELLHIQLERLVLQARDLIQQCRDLGVSQ